MVDIRNCAFQEITEAGCRARGSLGETGPGGKSLERGRGRRDLLVIHADYTSLAGFFQRFLHGAGRDHGQVLRVGGQTHPEERIEEILPQTGARGLRCRGGR